VCLRAAQQFNRASETTQADLQLWLASSGRTIGARAHGRYGIGICKGLDISLVKQS
jgi:hypothetical protein